MFNHLFLNKLFLFFTIINAIESQLKRLPSNTTTTTLTTERTFLTTVNKTKLNSTTNIFNSTLNLVKGQFISKKVSVKLNCKADETLVNLNFTEPFKGVIQVGNIKITSCTHRGNGKYYYQIRIPHNDCGTQHVVSSGSFFNTISIRYHQSLEMEGDLSKSILCKFIAGTISVG